MNRAERRARAARREASAARALFRRAGWPDLPPSVERAIDFAARGAVGAPEKVRAAARRDLDRLYGLRADRAAHDREEARRLRSVRRAAGVRAELRRRGVGVLLPGLLT